MSTITNFSLLENFGTRLREERLRLGYSQNQFAQIGGVKRGSQILYEQSERKPTFEYIARITDAGADFRYLLTGERSADSGGEICLNPAILDKALTLADRLGRDEKGRMYDLEIRNTLTKAVLLAVADKTQNQINWPEIEEDVRSAVL